MVPRRLNLLLKRLDNPVNITDIAPTITDLFGIKSPDQWIGKKIEE